MRHQLTEEEEEEECWGPRQRLWAAAYWKRATTILLSLRESVRGGYLSMVSDAMPTPGVSAWVCVYVIKNA
jgi:hypothetical protein